jgi:hypothetical protein
MWDGTPGDYCIGVVKNGTNRLTTSSVFLYRTDTDELLLGVTTSGTSKIYIKTSASSQKGIRIDRFDSTTSGADLIRVNDDSIAEMFSVTAAGKAKGTGSGTTSASFQAIAQTAPTTPVEGDWWNDSTQKSITQFISGVKQYGSTTLLTKTDTTTVANTTTETSLIGTIVGTNTLPANFFTVGKTLRIKGYGFHSGASSPNITVKVKFGSTVILTTGSVASGNSSNTLWDIEAVITNRTTGAGGTVFGQGVYRELDGTPKFNGMINTTATTVDTTASQVVTVTVQWGTASASNTFSFTNLSMEVLN